MRIVYIVFFLTLSAVVKGYGQTGQSSTASTSLLKRTKFYPSPAVTQVTFEFDLGYDKNYSFEIYNFAGKKVFHQFAITPKIIIPVSDLYRGVYIFEVKNNEGKIIESGRLQVMH